MSEVWNGRKIFPRATSPTTYTKTHFDTIHLYYRNMQRNDTANRLQFVTRRCIYGFNIGIYFGGKIFGRYSIRTRPAWKSWVMETTLLSISKFLIKNSFGALNNKNRSKRVQIFKFIAQCNIHHASPRNGTQKNTCTY